jgi:uncharacterized protein (TIGR01244 family)
MKRIFLYISTCFAAAGMAAAADPQGIPNFHKVDELVYRGAQPTSEGFKNLAKLGVKTVIDLRETDGRSAEEKKDVEAAGMHYVNIPMRGMHRPSDEQVASVLKLFNDKAAGPVFVHCRRGADRTGTVVACYRISHDGWENEKALAEARDLGMAWIERAMHTYVREYKVKPQEASLPAVIPAAVLAPVN